MTGFTVPTLHTLGSLCTIISPMYRVDTSKAFQLHRFRLKRKKIVFFISILSTRYDDVVDTYICNLKQ